MELTPRLQAIANQIHAGARVADVGTDHGYLPVWLLLNGRIDWAVAADLREGPLNHAKETARHYGTMERMSFRLCDGLTGIDPEEVDTVVIAGMGGETISSILGAAPWTKGGVALLLQPMTHLAELRLWLQENGYAILNEQIIREGKRLYSIWNVKGGEMPPMSPAELWAGQQSREPLRREYLAYIRGKAEKAMRGQQAASAPDQEAIAELEAVLSGLNQMEKELGHDDDCGRGICFFAGKSAV